MIEEQLNIQSEDMEDCQRERWLMPAPNNLEGAP